MNTDLNNSTTSNYLAHTTPPVIFLSFFFHHSQFYVLCRIKNSLLDGTASPTVEKETFQRSLLAAQLANSKSNGKKAVNAPPVNIGWDSHKPVVSLVSSM